MGHQWSDRAKWTAGDEYVPRFRWTGQCISTRVTVQKKARPTEMGIMIHGIVGYSYLVNGNRIRGGFRCFQNIASHDGQDVDLYCSVSAIVLSVKHTEAMRQWLD